MCTIVAELKEWLGISFEIVSIALAIKMFALIDKGPRVLLLRFFLCRRFVFVAWYCHTSIYVPCKIFIAHCLSASAAYLSDCHYLLLLLVRHICLNLSM